MRRLLVLLAVASVAVLPLPSTGAAVPAAAYDTDGATMNILPPGSSGNVDATDLAAMGGSRTATAEQPKNFADQLEMYDKLNTVAPYSLTDSALSTYYKDASIGDPSTVVSTETPKSGV